MASSRDFLEYIREQLSDTEDIACRAMMGEFIIYCRGRIIGGIYDDRFLVKPTATARAMMPDAEYQLPYPGAKEMLVVDNVDDRDFLNQLVNAIADELPLPRRKRK
ncbi:MAG: TfoX/Sxy family protein [Erysipelotrichaceae bacterium]|nr:TfoX/Sxy family protein [Erysipelotrichaceae bacterium]